MFDRFENRDSTLEIMDNLDFSEEVIYQTLKELKFINHWLGGNQVTIAGFKKLLKTHQHDKELITIADLGSGGGDMLLCIEKFIKSKTQNYLLTGIDANQHIVDYARKNTSESDKINYHTVDIFSEEFNTLEYDFITFTLFAHHFSDEQLVLLFKKLKYQARKGIIVNDLHRHWLAYFSIKILTGLFSKSYMVRNDAPLSVARSFRKCDWEKIFSLSGISNYKIKWKWAFRWMIVIDTSRSI